MLVEAAEFRNRVLEFIVFFLATALVWGEIDLCRFLIFGRKPMVDRFIWVFSWYSLVWIIAKFRGTATGKPIVQVNAVNANIINRYAVISAAIGKAIIFIALLR